MAEAQDVMVMEGQLEPESDHSNPQRIANVEFLDVDTVGIVIAKVHESTSADLLAYRESEVDGLWSLADMAVKAGDPRADQWLELLWTAHDHIGDGDRHKAIVALERLRDLLAMVDRHR